MPGTGDEFTLTNHSIHQKDFTIYRDCPQPNLTGFTHFHR